MKGDNAGLFHVDQNTSDIVLYVLGAIKHMDMCPCEIVKGTEIILEKRNRGCSGKGE